MGVVLLMARLRDGRTRTEFTTAKNRRYGNIATPTFPQSAGLRKLSLHISIPQLPTFSPAISEFS
jgi:hypothetical protein